MNYSALVRNIFWFPEKWEIFTERVLIALCRFGLFANAECTANSELLSRPSVLSNGGRERSTVTLNYSVDHTEAAAKPENKSKWDQWLELFKALQRSKSNLLK